MIETLQRDINSTLYYQIDSIKKLWARFKLFNNSIALKAILAFLNVTKIGIKSDLEEEERENLRNLDLQKTDSMSSFINSSTLEGIGQIDTD